MTATRPPSLPSISTHTPHARRDAARVAAFFVAAAFLLTRLMRGVTNTIIQQIFCPVISTHTPHARRDNFFFPFGMIVM